MTKTGETGNGGLVAFHRSALPSGKVPLHRKGREKGLTEEEEVF